MNFPEMKIVEFKVSDSCYSGPVTELRLTGKLSIDTMRALDQACCEGKTLSFILVDASKPFPEVIPGTRFDFQPRGREVNNQHSPLYCGERVAEVTRVETTTVYR